MWPARCPSLPDHSGPICQSSKTHAGITFEGKEEFILATARKQFRNIYIKPWVLLGLESWGYSWSLICLEDYTLLHISRPSAAAWLVA